MCCAYQDTEGVIVLNIPSYMGGVDLWQNDNDHDDGFSSQSMHDKMLEIVCISGTWHLGKLQVNIICVLNTLLTYFCCFILLSAFQWPFSDFRVNSYTIIFCG
jgi:hypothetical protein